MNALASLESLGLVLCLSPEGGITLTGLKRLTPEKRGYALSLAKEHKAAIMKALRERERIMREEVTGVLQ